MISLGSSDTDERQLKMGASQAFVRGVDRLSGLAGVLSALGLFVMIGFICFEVSSRSLFNEPTVWVTEYSTYLLVGIAFMALAYAQKEDAHIRVELVVGNLNEPARRRLDVLTAWLGFLFVAIAGWQMTSFNFQEFVNDTRNWGLLATPQWIPELLVSFGFGLFVLAILADICRKSERDGDRSAQALRFWIVPITLLFVAGVLTALGPYPVPLWAGVHDWGSVAIVAGLGVLVWALSGIRTLAAVAACIAVAAVVFDAVRGEGLLAVGTVLVVCLLVLLLIGMRIALALGMVGMLGLYFLLPQPQLSVLAERSWNSINTFTLTAIPMFVLMGGLLLRSGVTTQMFDALLRWFGRTPGGIAHASVGACGVFAAVSGSSLATAATMGAVACPEMIKRGYSPQLTYGVIAAGGTLGILIPPSIAMIIYGTTVGAPISDLFIAGIIPGLVLMASFMLAILVWSAVITGSAPRGTAYTMREKLSALVGVLPFLVLIVSVLGSLYMGIATPTEAGAIGVAVSVLLCAQRGKISWSMLAETALETVKVTSLLLLIVVGASILSWVFDVLTLPVSLVSEVQKVDLAPWMVMGLIALIYILLGMFIDPISMMLMTLPVAYPLVAALGFDKIWFGIALVMMIEVGMITPPVGIILFVLRGISGDVPLKSIVQGVIPFVVMILLNVVLIYFYPDIVTWLPGEMR